MGKNDDGEGRDTAAAAARLAMVVPVGRAAIAATTAKAAKYIFLQQLQPSLLIF